jgi:hypothetical protein
MSTGTLIIQRTSQYVNKMRTISIYIDDALQHKIHDSEEINIDLSEGPHLIQARIDYCRTAKIPILIRKDESLIFELGSPLTFKPGKSLVDYRLLLKTLLFISGLVLAGYLDDSRFIYLTLGGLALWTSIDWINGDYSPSILYYLTFGYRKYIYLRQTG